MPTIQTYIHSEDLGRYIAIQSKGKGAWSRYIHACLGRDIPSTIPSDLPKKSIAPDMLVQKNRYGEANVIDEKELTPPKSKLANAVITPEQAYQKVKEIFPGAERFCKNGHSIPEGHTKCLGKGCQYS